METHTPAERAAAAERAWLLAKRAGDERLRAAALADYRAARREMRRPVRTRVNPREASALCRAFRPVDYRSGWA